MNVLFFVSGAFSNEILKRSKSELKKINNFKLVSNSKFKFIYPTEEYSKLKQYNCEIAISLGFTEKIKINNVRTTYGSYNIHQSILPNYKGRHPIQTMIINGEKEYGCTLHVLDKNFDSGDIILSTYNKFKIVPKENTVKNLAIRDSSFLLNYLINNYKTGLNSKVKQKYSKDHIYAKKRTPTDSEITSELSFETVKNMIRALTVEGYKPFIVLNKKKLIVQNVFKYNLKNKNLLEYELINKKVYLEISKKLKNSD